MGFLLWGILSIGVFVGFIYIAVIATRLIKAKLGLGAAVFFVIAFLSFTTHSSDANSNAEDKVAKWGFPDKDSVNFSFKTIDIELEKNMFSHFGLSIYCGYKKNTFQLVPANGSADCIGLRIGTDWVTHSISLFEDGAKTKYRVNYSIAYKLLGLTIFTRVKNAEGEIKPDFLSQRH